jgi:hypothetical protein
MRMKNKQKVKGIMAGVLISGIIVFIIEYYFVGLMSCCDCGYHEWNDHLFFLIPTGAILIFTGLITNYISKTEGIISRMKEGAITGFIGSMLYYFLMLLFVIWPKYFNTSIVLEMKDAWELYLSYMIPIVIFTPFFMGLIAAGEALGYYWRGASEEPKPKIAVAVLIVLALIIAPIALNLALANDETAHNEEWSRCWPGPTIKLSKDENDKTLTVSAADPFNLEWSNFEVMGNATIPSGTVDVGDVITNCSGAVKLVYKPCDTIIGSWDFA